MGKAQEIDDKRAGQVIAEAGADIYEMLDKRPDLGEREDIRNMMYHINQVSSSLIKGESKGG